MTDEQWRTFFQICSRVLGPGSRRAAFSQSWCGWTTFQALREGVTYWEAGVPSENELESSYTTDGGTWGQPFSYQDLAHVIVPRTFDWESGMGAEFKYGTKEQDIDSLSRELAKAGIMHRKTDLVLEIKLY